MRYAKWGWENTVFVTITMRVCGLLSRHYISQIALKKIVIIATHVVSDVEYIARDVIMLKKGVIVDNAQPHEMVKKLEGKVWHVPASESDIDEMQRQFHINSIIKTDNGIELRVLSEEKPSENARTVSPTLEDYYLSVFGN